MVDAPIGDPPSSRIRKSVSHTGTCVPSLRTRTVSKCSTGRSALSSPQDGCELARPVIRAESLSGVADNLRARPAEHPLGGRVPAHSDVLEGAADDRVFRAPNDGGGALGGLRWPPPGYSSRAYSCPAGSDRVLALDVLEARHPAVADSHLKTRRLEGEAPTKGLGGPVLRQEDALPGGVQFGRLAHISRPTASSRAP